jgi:hypothetical protein
LINPNVALLDEVGGGDNAAAIGPGDREHQPQVALDHRLLGPLVALFDPLGERYLLGGGQEC